MRNSFKELEELQLKEFESKSEEIKNQIDGTTSSYKFIGDVLDLYFSKVMGVFVAMSGGTPGSNGNKSNNNIDPTD